MVRDHTAVNDQALALVKRLNVTPQDNDTSEALVKQADAKQAELNKLEGAGFDKAYADNEVNLQQGADLLRPIHDRTAGVDGWVSLEVSPLLAYDTQRTVEAASSLHAAAARPNLFIKIPGTKQGVPAIEEAIFRGVPIKYLASAEAYMRGLERRIASGLSPDVRSVASLFVSRWDKATMDKLPDNLRDRLGIAIAKWTYAAYRDLLDAERWQRLENWGARTQRLLFASTGTKDPRAPDTLYIGALTAPNTINTIPEEPLSHFADHGEVGGVLARDGGRASETLSAIVKAGVDIDALAADLQSEGTKAFDGSWSDLLKAIETKSKRSPNERLRRQQSLVEVLRSRAVGELAFEQELAA
jgi:transaldolase